MYKRATSIRLLMTVFVSQSLLSASQIAIFTLLTIMAADISGQQRLASIPSTLMTLAIALAALPIGLIMGRFGRRLGLVISYGVSVLGAFLGIFAIIQSAFWLLILSSILIGMGRAGGNQSRFIAGDLFYEHERARMIGILVFAGTIGSVFGPMLVVPGRWITDYLAIDSHASAWVIATILYALATLITIIALRPEPMHIARIIERDEHQKKKKKVSADDSGRSARELLRLPRVQLAISSMLISQVVMVMLMVMTPLHMVHHGYDKGGASISLVISAHTMGMFGFSWLTGYLVDRYGQVSMMIAGAVTLILSAIIAPLGSELVFLVTGLFLLGIGWNFGYVAGSSLLSDVLEGKERTRMQGVNDMLVSGAAALGSLSSAPLFEFGGYVSIAGLGIIITLLFFWLIRLLSPTRLRTHPMA